MSTKHNHPAFITAAHEGAVLNELGHTATEKITCEQTGGAYYAFDVISPPGLGIPPHIHSLEDEVILIVEGEYDVVLGDQVFRAGPGAVLNFARGTAHGFANAGTKPGKTFWVVTPGASFQAFFRDLARVPAGPPDLAKLSALFGRYGMDLLPPPGL